MVQVRRRDLSVRRLAELTVQLASLCAGGCTLVVNDRVDVALACSAQGVHLPEAGLLTAVAKDLSDSLLVGRSVHSAAPSDGWGGLDYAIFGSVFATSSHPDLAPAGLAALATAAAACPLPMVAIGGITAANARAVMAAGAAGVAVTSAVLEASDPGEAAAEIWAAIAR